VIIDGFAGDRQLFWVYGRYRAELALDNYEEYAGYADQEKDLPKLAEAMHAQLPCFTVEELEHALNLAEAKKEEN
jgi:hypothetical protein